MRRLAAAFVGTWKRTSQLTTLLLGSFAAKRSGGRCTGFQVRWEGSRIDMTGEFQTGDERMAWHEVFILTTGSSFTQTLDVGKVGEALKRVATITATRKK
jgi:hypothetical protein